MKQSGKDASQTKCIKSCISVGILELTTHIITTSKQLNFHCHYKSSPFSNV